VSQSSYYSHDELRLHFGLGPLEKADGVEVRWPSGQVETLRDVAAGTLTADQASKRMPNLKRVGGVCPCSNSVRWIVEEPAAAST